MKIKGFERICNKWLIGLECLSKAHMWQINPGTSYFSEVSGSPDWNMPECFLQKVKEKVVYFAPLPTKEEAQCLIGLPGFGGNIYHI